MILKFRRRKIRPYLIITTNRLFKNPFTLFSPFVLVKMHIARNNLTFLFPLQLPQTAVILMNDNCTPRSDASQFTKTVVRKTLARWRTTVVWRRVELCPHNAQVSTWELPFDDMDFCRTRVRETEKQVLFQRERLRAERPSVRRRLGVSPVCDQQRLRAGNDWKVWFFTQFPDLSTEILHDHTR